MSVSFHYICRKASLVAAFMLFLQVGFSQKKTVAVSPYPSLDKAIEDNKSRLGKEFSVIVANADSVIYQKDLGDPATLRTPVAVVASSQWLTTALLLQLADEKLLSLDDPVSKYLPAFELYRRNYVTIRQCLTHQTGLGKEGFKLASFLDKKKFSSLEEEVTDILKKEIYANAGEEFRYTNYGMIVAARIAEVVTKKRFDQVIRTKLFVPLGMRNTSFVTEDGSASNPSGGAKSTAVDYTRFLQMILNNGKFGGKQILSEAAINEMRKLQVTSSKTMAVPKADEGFAFALGTWTTDANEAAGAKARTLVLPGLSGTWPMVDFSKGYVFLVLARNFSGEQTAAPYMELKQLIDQQVSVKKK